MKAAVLFLCTGNSCRSQMAEGWAKPFKGDALEAYSAGTSAARDEARRCQGHGGGGVDISGHHSKHMDELKGTLDYVVTVCDHANETCPVLRQGEEDARRLR